MAGELVWSSGGPRERETADGRRVIERPAVPTGVQRFIAKQKKTERLREESRAKEKAGRQEKHQARLIEDQQRKQERQARMREQQAESNINKRLGMAIINKREVLGLSLEQMAEVFGWEPGFFARVEDGSQGLYFDNAMKVISTLQIREELFVELADVHAQKQKLAAFVESKAREVEDQMTALQKQMDALRDKKNQISRVTNGRPGL